MAGNLPLPWTGIIGRSGAVAELGEIVQRHRLVTLVGAAGVGKTRLALEVARSFAQNHADEGWLVELAPITDPTHVPQTVAAALGVAEVKDQPLTETLVSALQIRTALILLDNCEHLTSACAHLVERLLRGSPNLTVVTTSREPLGVPGELVWRVSPLGAEDGTALFVERASSARPDLCFGKAQAPAVNQLCLALDGLPLAIELAAACLSFLTLHELLARLDQRFELLEDRQRTALRRPRSLRAVVDWSYDLLAPDEQHLFRVMSVFAGGCTLEAIQGVYRGPEAVYLVRSLVEKSLLVAEHGTVGKMRYRMLETLRQYASERLSDSSEEARARTRHLKWYLAVAQAAEPQLHRADQQHWSAGLQEDLDNFRAALTWSTTDAALREKGLRLISALATFWFLSGYSSQALPWFEMLLRDDHASGARALALAKCAFMYMRRGDPSSARPLAAAALCLAQETGDVPALAEASFQWGQVCLEHNMLDAAEEALTQALELSREVSWPAPYAVHRQLAALAIAAGQFQRALAHYQHALRGAREASDDNHVALLLTNLGCLELDLSDVAAARRHLRESVAASGGLSDERVADGLSGLAELACVDGEPHRAFVLVGAANALRKRSGAKPLPRVATRLQRRLAAISPPVAVEPRNAASARGWAMSRGQAIAYALGVGRRRNDSAPLTVREREVIGLVADGVSTRSIAERLVVTHSTAKRHIEHIMAKLNVHTRAEVAAWAIRAGFTPTEDNDQPT